MTDADKIEILKSLRSQWMTSAEMCHEFKSAPTCVRRWMAVASENGITKSRKREKECGRKGVAETEFAVVAAWGGIA